MQRTSLCLTRSGKDERCRDRESVIQTLQKAIEWVQEYMKPDETADVRIMVDIPADEMVYGCD